MELSELRPRLASVQQSNVLRFADQLSPDAQKKLAGQISALDLTSLSKLVDSQVRQKAHIPLPKDIQPVKAYPRVPTPEVRQLYADAEKRGHELLRAGKVAAFLVAGGQGTRLGYDGPKGEFPVTPIHKKPLFQ